MQSSKISVISPVYNAEKYIRKCINSIIAQTFQDWELILVDDGSPDACGVICDEYAARDSRIRVIHKQNGGVSEARQTGLDAALGEYVIHVDPDDWVEPTMLEELYGKARETGADIVVCDYYINKDMIQTYVCQTGVTGREATLRGLVNGSILGSLWNKLVRRSLIIGSGTAFFPGLNYCEDLLFCIRLLKNKEVSVAHLPKAFYHYVQNSQSITNHYTPGTYEMRNLYVEKLYEMLPVKEYGCEMRRAKLGVVSEAFINGILSNGESRRLVWENRRAAFLENHSPRWIAGYLCILLGLKKIAHKFIKY